MKTHMDALETRAPEQREAALLAASLCKLHTLKKTPRHLQSL